MVPFILQTTMAVAFTGWLTIRNGERAVNEVVEKYQREIAAHIRKELSIALDIPHHINHVNAEAVRSGYVNFDDPDNLSKYFWQQLHSHPGVTNIYAGSTKGGIIGVGQRGHDDYRNFQTPNFREGKFTVYRTNHEGNRLERLPISGEYYDARKRPWYEAALEAEDSTWSEIYVYAGERRLGISASRPLYSELGQIQGVVAVDLVLENISDFLKAYHQVVPGHTTIIERSGYVVATSTPEVPFIQQFPNAQRERRHLSESGYRLTQGIADYFSQEENLLTSIHQETGGTIHLDRDERHFIRVLPFKDDKGLDWLIVIALPESEFLGQIHDNTRQTVIMCLAALGIAVIIGSLTSQWVTSPISKLCDASQAIAEGNFTQTVDIDRGDEVGILAKGFNRMATQLQHQFQSMEDRNQDLEHRVQERTRHLLKTNHKLEAEIAARKQVGESLQASEEKYRTLFEGLHDAVMIFDGEKFVDCNRATLHIFQCKTKEEFCCKHPIDFSPTQQPDGQTSSSLAKDYLSIARKKGSHQFEWVHKRLDGQSFWADVWLSTVEIDGQSVFQAVIRDITQRKLNEEKLIETSSLAELGSNVGAALTRGDTLPKTLEQCADALICHLPLDSARIWVLNTSNQMLELLASRGQYQHLDPFQRRIPVGQSRIGQIAQNQIPYFTDSLLNDLHINKQEWGHQPNPVQFAGYPLTVEGQTVGVMAVMTRKTISDATRYELKAIANEIALGIHHRHVEDALRESEERYRSIVENTSDLIATLSLEGTFIYASPNYKNVLGYEPSTDLIDEPWAFLIHPDDLSTLRQFAEQLTEVNHSMISPEYRVRTKQGDWRWYLSAASCVRDRQGTPLYLVSIARDISDRVQTEETLRHAKEMAESANRAKGTFLRTMSHELRTPLNGILGFAQSLQKTPGLPQKHYDGLQVVQRSGMHLLSLIEELLDFSKIDAQKMEIHPITFNLKELLAGVIELFTPRAQQKGITFRSDIETSIASIVWGDVQRLRQVLINLIGNAIKFTDHGYVHLKVTAISDPLGEHAYQNGDHGLNTASSSLQVFDFQTESLHVSQKYCEPQHLRFQIIDTGSGIAEEDREIIFQPFSQIPHSRKPMEGTGLGLAISNKLIELMGGTLNVTSTLGKGSCFWFDINLPIVSNHRDGVEHHTDESNSISSNDSSQHEATDMNGLNPSRVSRELHPVISVNHSVLLDSQRNGEEPLSVMRTPNTEAIAQLKSFARIGDIQAIATYLEKLDQQDPELNPFVTTMRQLLQTFQMRKIREFLEAVSSTNQQ